MSEVRALAYGEDQVASAPESLSPHPQLRCDGRLAASFPRGTFEALDPSMPPNTPYSTLLRYYKFGESLPPTHSLNPL